MLVCPSCGQQTRAQSRFCPNCGRPLDGRLAPGTLLGKGDYRIVRSISKGGMGAVYLAEDRRAFDRLCIVKQMLDYYDPTDPEERRRAEERFQEEGRTLAALSHPGIPRIYAFLSENGRYYIVMEYVQGENLESFVTHLDETGRVVTNKRLPREEVVRYTIQACRILEYLHNRPRPVVHQDIKPANLILESQLGEVRLVDFGTARAEIPPGANLGDGTKSSIYGTDGYAPPEQYRGQPVPRSDVFALAATVYHLLTDDDPREHPFKWPKLNTLPREIAVALERALRESPDQRISARELRQALEALSTPNRTLEAFTFPGGTQIRTVGSLPALADEHWDAARSFLYKGDFQRWLRDINRHDLVLTADDIIKREQNRDAGLEAFLHVVDPGLAHPKIVVDQPHVDLGAVARESALIRRITVLNVSRGYTQATISSSQPWLEVYPERLHLWAGIPTDVRINVHAENLPFRSEQRGVITVKVEGQDTIEVPVTARVSLTREMWRLTWRAISAALPESWRTFRSGWRTVARTTNSISAPFVRHSWLLWLVWLLMGLAIAGAIYLLPPERVAQVLPQLTPQLPEIWPEGAEIVARYGLPAILGPPFIVSVVWLVFVLVMLVGGAVWGALLGAWKSFFK
jgi:serine/threonine protein kinase